MTLSIKRNAMALGAAAALGVSAPMAVAQGSAGINAVNLPAGSDTYVSVPYPKQAVGEFTVAPSGINGNTVTLDSASFSAGQFGTNSESEPLFYARFTSGSLEGQWFNIASHDSNSVDLNRENSGQIASLSNAQGGDTLKIVPHHTLGSTLPPSAEGLSFVESPGPSDQKTVVLLPDNTNVGINKSPSRSFIFNGPAGGWLERGGFAVSNNVVLPPQSYFIVRNTGQDAPDPSDDPKTLVNEATNDLVLYTSGPVRSGKVVEQLPVSGSQNDVNVSVDNTSEIELQDLQLGGTSAFASSAGPSNLGDILLVFDNNQIATNKSPSASFIYNAGAGGWLKRGDFSPANDFDLPAGAVLIIRKEAGTPGTSVEWSQNK